MQNFLSTITKLRMCKKVIFLAGVLTCCLLISTSLYAGDGHASVYQTTWESNDSVMFQVGEELTYNVSYTIFDLGQIRIKIADKEVDNGTTKYTAIAYIDTYKGIPFVDLHTIYETKLQSPVYSEWFRARTKQDGKWYAITYDIDYSKRQMDISEGEFGSTNITKKQSVTLDTIYQDGLSLFYFARANVKNHKTINVPTIIQEQKVSTQLNFMNEITTQEIDAVKYPIDVVHFTGRADFVGVYGMSGDFEGWFSNDDASVPIVAKMKVLIGNIRIELMKWKRDGWTPPQGAER